jgi:hypothetical protein
MGTILLALLQLSAGAGLDQAKAAYEQCMTAEAVHLGAGNQESADTILRAVRFKCDPAWQQLSRGLSRRRRNSDRGPGSIARPDEVAHDAEGAATAALLEARASVDCETTSGKEKTRFTNNSTVSRAACSQRLTASRTVAVTNRSNESGHGTAGHRYPSGPVTS